MHNFLCCATLFSATVLPPRYQHFSASSSFFYDFAKIQIEFAQAHAEWLQHNQQRICITKYLSENTHKFNTYMYYHHC